MPYSSRIINIPGHYRIVKIDTSKGKKEVRKWCEGYKRKIKIWIPEKEDGGEE